MAGPFIARGGDHAMSVERVRIDYVETRRALALRSASPDLLDTPARRSSSSASLSSCSSSCLSSWFDTRRGYPMRSRLSDDEQAGSATTSSICSR